LSLFLLKFFFRFLFLLFCLHAFCACISFFCRFSFLFPLFIFLRNKGQEFLSFTLVL
jgi:hypothetical protein